MQGNSDLEARLLSEDVGWIKMILEVGARERCTSVVEHNQNLVHHENQCQDSDQNTDDTACARLERSFFLFWVV